MTPPVARSILEKRIAHEDITQERFVKGHPQTQRDGTRDQYDCRGKHDDGRKPV